VGILAAYWNMVVQYHPGRMENNCSQKSPENDTKRVWASTQNERKFYKCSISLCSLNLHQASPNRSGGALKLKNSSSQSEEQPKDNETELTVCDEGGCYDSFSAFESSLLNDLFAG